MNAVALLVAAGRGHRARSRRGTKQFVPICGKSVLVHTMAPFIAHASIDHVQVVIHADDMAPYQGAIRGVRSQKLLAPVAGGESRQQSVLAGLRAVASLEPGTVVIHDAVRPFVTRSDIDGVLAALCHHDGAIVAVPVVDTLKRESAHRDGGYPSTAQTLERAGLWRAQTPQAFRYDVILRAHEQAAASGRFDFTDDASIAEAAGVGVALVEGSERNFKITTPADFERAEREMGMAAEFRTGTGFDVHRFAAGDHVWLCGVQVAHTHTLSGHSDADVAMHALTDAILGAIADGDIGAHFPPSDPQWKGAPSKIFLVDARDRVRALGGTIVNVDVTMMCELPKVGPHREAMRARLADLLEIDIGRVAVKATTTEGLGFAGRREGIAAMASAMVRLG